MQENDKKDRNRALATTLSVHTVLLIFFFFYGLTYQDPPPEYGIPVSFGNSLDGAGDDAAAPEGSEAPSTAAAETRVHPMVRATATVPAVQGTAATTNWGHGLR